VGRNISQNLALLGAESWLLTVVGDDFYGQSLLNQTRQAGVHIEKCLIVAGENTSSYLSFWIIPVKCWLPSTICILPSIYRRLFGKTY
jgi:hypothetical protein